MHPNLALHSPGPHTRDDPSRHGVQWNCATDQAQRRGVKRSAGPYTGLFYPHLRATELGMRVESVLNIDAPQSALHSPGPHSRNDPSRHGVQWKVATDQAQRPGMKRSAGPYTGLFHPHLRAQNWGCG